MQPARGQLVSYRRQRYGPARLAEVVELPGVLAYGANLQEAIARAEAFALRVLADQLEHGEELPGPIRISFAKAA